MDTRADRTALTGERRGGHKGLALAMLLAFAALPDQARALDEDAGEPGASLGASIDAGHLEARWRTATEGAWALLAAASRGGRSHVLACGVDLMPSVHAARWPLGTLRVDPLELELRLVQLPGLDGTDALLAAARIRVGRGPKASAAARLLLAPLAQAPPAVAVPFHIQSCSLGCSAPVGQITCGLVQSYQNQDLELRFPLSVDLASVTPQSYAILDTSSGSAAGGTFFLAPPDHRRLVFRPSLSFDLQGQPHFGFSPGGTYLVHLPGVSQGDPGPFVQSNSGLSNQHRLSCSILTSGILDYVPGAPTVSVLVDVVTGYNPVTGLPSSFAYGVPAGGATNVWSASKVTFAFDDIMAPAGMIDLVTGTSPSFNVLVDPDGDLTTTLDRYPQPGSFSFQFDLAARTSRLVFAPSPYLPHSGGGSRPLKIVVEVPSSASDLVGNPLANPGSLWFVPER